LEPGNESPNKGKHLSKETKEKISIKLKGCKRSKTSIEKTRSSHIGLKHSDKTKQKISKRLREVSYHPVYQLDDNNNILQTFNSTHDIERTLGYAHQNIISCCKGKLKKAYGFKWIYKEDYKCQN
jgi:group I intron endonuclease